MLLHFSLFFFVCVKSLVYITIVYIVIFCLCLKINVSQLRHLFSYVLELQKGLVTTWIGVHFLFMLNSQRYKSLLKYFYCLECDLRSLLSFNEIVAKVLLNFAVSILEKVFHNSVIMWKILFVTSHKFVDQIWNENRYEQKLLSLNHSSSGLIWIFNRWLTKRNASISQKIKQSNLYL